MVKQSVENIVEMPEGFTADIDGQKVVIKGAGKEAERQFKAQGISFKKDGNKVIVTGAPFSRRTAALVKTIASHVNNMASGLQTEYVYKMTIVYSHFPMNVAVKGQILEINNFVGEKKTRIAKIVPGATVTIKGKAVTIKSNNKEVAGQTAGNIEGATKVRGKDKRIYQDGIFIVTKALQEKKEESK